MSSSKTKRTGNVKADLRKLADVVRREVDAGADTVEEIHRSIARMPLDVLAKLDIFEETVKDVRKVQETSIGAIYDLIRKVNHEVGKLAKEVLDGREKRVAAARKPGVKKAGATRRPTPQTRAAATQMPA
jgi:cob(I)alamin adenosyltransferase